MEDASQEEKQNFLRENILNKGYNVNEFVDFLRTKKGEEGEDISNWSMVDLYEVVQEFVSKNSAPTETKPQLSQSNTYNPKPTNNLPKPPTKRTGSIPNTNAMSTLTDEDFGIITPEFLKCQKSETTELSKYNDIQIIVNDPQKVNNGFFSKTFINFLITTNPLNITVRRKHADFVWLRERLSIIFNLNVLPRLPKKGKVNEDKHINKRMRNLERFLNYLVKDPLIKNSNILYDFLSIEKEDEFEKRKKKIYNRMKTPIELKDVKTCDGKIRINVTSNKEVYLDNIKNNAAFNETCLKKFNENFKTLKTEMNTVISRILSFGPLFDKLIKISTTYLDNNVIIESYNQMKRIFDTCAELFKKQKAFFLNEVKEYLKLLSGNYHHMRELHQIIEVQKNNYTKLSKSLISKKTDLFKKGDTNSWQLDPKEKSKINEFFSDRIASYKRICYKDTINAIQVKEKYGYHLNKIISEYQRLRNINTIENKKKVIEFSKKESEIVNEYFKIMSEIIEIMEKCEVTSDKDEIEMEQKIQPIEENNNVEEKNISTEEIENKNEENKNEIIEEKKEENKNEIIEENKGPTPENNINKKEEYKEPAPTPGPKIYEKEEEKKEENQEKNDEEKQEKIDEEKENKVKDENKEEKNKEEIEEKKEEEKKEEEKKEEEKKEEEKKEEEKKEETLTIKTEEKVEEKTGIKTEIKTEENTEIKTEIKTEEKTEIKAEEKTEIKGEEKTEIKTEEKPEIKKLENTPENQEKSKKIYI